MASTESCCKSFAFTDACQQFGLEHICAKPRAPETNELFQAGERSFGVGSFYNHRSRISLQIVLYAGIRLCKHYRRVIKGKVRIGPPVVRD